MMTSVYEEDDEDDDDVLAIFNFFEFCIFFGGG